MKTYQTKPVKVTAMQWFKRGDHPAVYSWAVSIPPILSLPDEPLVLGEPTEWAHSVTQYDTDGTPRTSDPMLPGYWVVDYGNGFYRGFSPEAFAARFEEVV